MKILVTSLPDIKKIAPQRPHHLLKYLSDHHDVTVLSVNAWWLEEKHDSYLDDCIKNIKIIYFTDKKINPVFQELSILMKYDHFDKMLDFDNFDVHINLNSLIAGYYLSQKFNVIGIPTVFDIADDLPERIKTSPRIPLLLKPLSKIIGKYMFLRCNNKAKKITTVTSYLMQIYDIPQKKLKIIPNGVDTTTFNNYPIISDELYDNDPVFILGFVGIFSEWVDLEFPFLALKNLIKNNYKIKMLVIGDGIKLQEFKDLASKYGISENISFKGYIPATYLKNYISNMDVCLVSYKINQDCQNSFPLKLLEYMACGKPVISVRLNGVVEAVGERVLYANNSKELEQKIIELYNDPDKRERLGREGMKFVRENFSWDRISKDFENVLYEAKNEAA